MGAPSMLEDQQERRYEGLENMRRQAEQFENSRRPKRFIFERPERTIGRLSDILQRLPLQRKVFDRPRLIAMRAAELAKAREADRTQRDR
jgi:hypothetical protein